MEIVGQVALGGQGIVRTQYPALDGLAQDPLQLQIKGQRAGFIQSAQGLRQVQSFSPTWDSIHCDITNTRPVCAITSRVSTISHCIYVRNISVMRISRSTLVGTAVAVALFGGNAFAQQTAASQSSANKTDADNAATLQEVVVTGIRYSVKASIASKRAATNMTEVATAEDVGKLPAKNVADVLQTLPGVDTSSSVAGEGAFAENDRISLRGTPNSLTQTTIDGHFVSSVDWFI